MMEVQRFWKMVSGTFPDNIERRLRWQSGVVATTRRRLSVMVQRD
jgi:hypothetical protein